MKIPQSTIDAIAEHTNKHPAHQPAYATTDDINLLKAEMRANSIDIDSQLSIIRGIVLRLDAIESENQRLKDRLNAIEGLGIQK